MAKYILEKSRTFNAVKFYEVREDKGLIGFRLIVFIGFSHPLVKVLYSGFITGMCT